MQSQCSDCLAADALPSDRLSERGATLMQSQCSGSLAVIFVRLALTSCLCRASAAARCHMKSVRQLARCRRARAATSSIPTASAPVDVQPMRQQPAPFSPRRLPPLRSDCCLAAADAKSVQRLARCRIRSPRTHGSRCGSNQLHSHRSRLALTSCRCGATAA